MAIARCPECGRVSEPPECFICSYQWPEEPIEKKIQDQKSEDIIEDGFDIIDDIEIDFEIETPPPLFEEDSLVAAIDLENLADVPLTVDDLFAEPPNPIKKTSHKKKLNVSSQQNVSFSTYLERLNLIAQRSTEENRIKDGLFLYELHAFLIKNKNKF